MRAKVGALFALLVLCPGSALAATITVDAGGGGAFTAIQPAIDAAADGDLVLVKPGEYVIGESVTFKGKAITVRGEAGVEATVIRMSDTPTHMWLWSVVVFQDNETSASILEGFTLTGGKGRPVNGGGVCCSGASPTLSSCVITGNYASSGGGGVCCLGGSPVLMNCTIEDNTAGTGGGVCCEAGASAVLTNCTVARNAAYVSGGGVMCISASPELPASCSITSCIVWGNVGDAITVWEGSNVNVTYSCVESEGVWPGAGNTNADPRLCAWTTGEVWVDSSHAGPGSGTQQDPYTALKSALRGYRVSLRSDSPCRGAGQGGADMGAPLGSCQEQGFERRLVHLAAGTYSIQKGDIFHAVSVEGAARESTQLVGPVVGLQTGAVLSKVKVTGDGTLACVVVSGGEAPEIRECILADNINNPGMWCFDASPTLVDCIIRGNQALTGSGILCSGNAFPTLTRCSIVENSGEGSVYCSSGSSPTLLDCTIARNRSGGFGGGICCIQDASPTLVGCTITENTGWWGGGGLYCERNSSPVLRDCTIAGNFAFAPEPVGVSHAGGGVLCHVSSTPQLTNCIVWGNAGEDVTTDDTSAVLAAYSCIESGDVWTGEGNINFDPHFCAWPAGEVWVDAGNPNAGSGTQADPYSRLAAALSSHRLSLAQGSPCLGSGEDGKNMGAGLGTCEVVGSAECRIHLAAGTYTPEGHLLINRAGILGAGMGACTIEGTLYGPRSGAIVSGVTVACKTVCGIAVASGEGPRIQACEVSGLVSGYAGVMCADASPILTRCTIARNFGFYGGGVYCEQGSSLVLSDCAITEDSESCACSGLPPVECIGGEGAGINCKDSSLTLTGCLIADNEAPLNGGGIFCSGSSVVTLANCAITGNAADQRGGGILCKGSATATLVNCTIAGNEAPVRGGGILCGDEASVRLSNCIVWGNNWETIADQPLGVLAEYSCIETDPVWPGEGVIAADPLFVRGYWERNGPGVDDDVWVGGDYHLREGSPCIDTGKLPGAPAMDIEGNGRPCGAGVDMGAYELGECPIPAGVFNRGDSNSDAALNIADAIFTLMYLFAEGTAPSCVDTADTNDDGKVDIADAVTLLSHLFGGRGPLPAPFEICGVDPTPDEVGCDSFPPCAGR